MGANTLRNDRNVQAGAVLTIAKGHDMAIRELCEGLRSLVATLNLEPAAAAAILEHLRKAKQNCIN